MTSISAVIITYNEENNIERCIKSLQQVADEVVVLDSYSTDNTKSISEKLGARFVSYQFENHIQQKNKAIEFAAHDWVLSLDADEALDDQLIQSINEVKKSPQYFGYKMNRLANYCGKWIHHSGWYPDTKLRLFNKHKGAWGGTNPHDMYMLHDKNEKTGFLQGNILHYTFRTVTEHYAQANRYSDIGAMAHFKKGKRSNWIMVVFSPIIRFVRDYIFNLGFMDGAEGFTICKISAYTSYLKYKKMLALQNK